MPDTERDTTADLAARLLHSLAPAPEDALAPHLAQTIAAQPHATPDFALASLRAAQEAAHLLDGLASVAQTAASPLAAPLRALTDLNRKGQPDEAARHLDQTLAALTPDQSDLRDALTDIALHQDRLRHDATAAATRLLNRLRATPQAGGLFKATHALWETWFDRGDAQNLTFDLAVAQRLARANLDRAKGAQHSQSLGDLGITLYRLGQTEGAPARHRQAAAAFRAFLAEHPRKNDPAAWASVKVNLALALIAQDATDPALRAEAARALTDALTVQTQAAMPDLWAETSAHLAALQG